MGNLVNNPRAASTRKPSVLLLLLACATLIRCGGGGDPSAPSNAELRVIAGSNQVAELGAALPAPIVVQVQDPQTGGKPGVHLHASLALGGTVTPADAVTDAAGQATFAWTLANSSGTQQLVIEDATLQLRTTVSATARTAGPVASVTVSPGTAQIPPGQTRQFSATLKNALGTILADRVVAWTSSNTAVATVSPTTGLVTAVAIGSATITATSESVSGTAAIAVATLTPTQLSITTQPAGVTSGQPFAVQPVVEVRDAFGQLVAQSTALVTARIQDGTGTLTGTVTVQAVGGVARFLDLRITGTGVHSLQFTSPPLTGATSESFTIPLSATALRVITQPSGAVSGAVFATQPVVELIDQSGARVTAGTFQVTAARDVGTGVLSGTLTVTTSNGLATFSDLRITGTGLHSIAFSATGLAGVSSQTFSVGGGASLAITTQPSGATIGVDLTTQPVVEIRDAGGALVSTSNAAVTASIASGNAPNALSGTTTVQAVNGVATFTNLRINAGAGGTTTLSFTSPGLSSVTSNGFAVSAGAAPSVLVAVREPGGASSGVTFGTQPVVQIRTSLGEVDGGSSAQVTVTIASGTGTLAGTTTISAVGGVATFSDLRITGSGQHTLRYSSPGLASINSAPFTVATSPSIFALNVGATTPATVQAGQNITTPFILDMSGAAGANVASLSFNIAWDVNKFTFVSITPNGASGFFLTANTSNAATGGTINIGGFSTFGATTTQTLYTLVLTAKTGTGGSSTQVTATVTAAADNNANNVTLTPRNLAVNITP